MDEDESDGAPERQGAVRGLELRSLLVLELLARGRPTAMAELVATVARAGIRVEGRPSKEIADALRWEVRRGRVVRLGRGIYAPGAVAKVTRHRMRARVAVTRNRMFRASSSGAGPSRRTPPERPNDGRISPSPGRPGGSHVT